MIMMKITMVMSIDVDNKDETDDESSPAGLAGSQAAMQALQYQLAAAASLG